MLSLLRKRILTQLIRNSKCNNSIQPFSRFSSLSATNRTLQPRSLATIAARFKSKSSGKRKQPAQESDDEDDDKDDAEDEIVDKSSKTMRISTTSMRMDAILKGGLNVARNKVDLMFYESKVRLNGARVYKKSAHIEAGDEIDVIKGFSPSNPKFLVVARVEVLGAEAEEDRIVVKIRRCKSLVIENYEDPWKSSQSLS